MRQRCDDTSRQNRWPGCERKPWRLISASYQNAVCLLLPPVPWCHPKRGQPVCNQLSVVLQKTKNERHICTSSMLFIDSLASMKTGVLWMLFCPLWTLYTFQKSRVYPSQLRINQIIEAYLLMLSFYETKPLWLTLFISIPLYGRLLYLSTTPK